MEHLLSNRGTSLTAQGDGPDNDSKSDGDERADSKEPVTKEDKAEQRRRELTRLKKRYFTAGPGDGPGVEAADYV